MQIRLLSVGKVKKGFIRQGESEFIKRIKKYNPLIMDSVQEEKIVREKKHNDIREKEGDRLIKRIPQRSWIISLDNNGTLFSSKEFTQLIARIMNKGTAYLIFIIGGTLGLSSEIKSKSNAIVSLSRMTFTHEMTRLILLEQIYRSFTILNGEHYHK